MGNTAPSQLTGGAALSVEHISGSQKNRLKAAVRDWTRTRPLKETIKAAMPEVSDDYVDHFTRIAEDLSLKKGLPAKLVRIGAQHSAHDYDDDDQKKLIEGIYFDPSKHLNIAPAISKNILIHGQNDAGDHVILKDNRKNLGSADIPVNPIHPTAYYNMASQFFGLGDHVPVTATVRHPEIFEDHPTTVMKLHSGKSLLADPKHFYDAANKGREDGSLHKLALMDMVMGNADRHHGNMMASNGKVVNIDNDNPFTYSGWSTYTPAYAAPSHPDHGYEGILNDVPHIEANKWLQSLDKKKFIRELAKYPQKDGIIKSAVARLRLAQIMAKKGATLGQMYQAFAPKAKPNA